MPSKAIRAKCSAEQIHSTILFLCLLNTRKLSIALHSGISNTSNKYSMWCWYSNSSYWNKKMRVSYTAKINTNTYRNHTKNYHTKLLLLKAVVKSVLSLCASEDLLFAQLPFVTQSCLDSWNKRNSFE